jgi:SAM-dependent methyltransferase
MVLPRAHRGEYGQFAGIGQALPLQGADDLRLGAAQEGVGGLFQRDRGGQGDLVGRAQLLRGGGTLLHGGVIRLAGQREAQVCGGVFVGAIHAGGAGKLSKALQGMVQLRRCPLEVPAATRAEQHVAAEQYPRADKADVVVDVAGDLDDIEFDAQRLQLEFAAFVQVMGDMRSVRMSPPMHRHVVYFAQSCDAANVVVVAMCAQDGIQLQSALVQEGQHRRGLARIDYHGTVVVVDGPYVVVLQGGNRSNVVHWKYGKPAMPNCKVTAKSLSEWFATPQGDYVLAREQAYFDRTVIDIFGYNALQLGLQEHDFLRSNRMPLRLKGGNQPGNGVRLCCTELPFDSDSLDLVLLPHVLEFAEFPHQILREAARVLRPEGNLIISGFNPRSLWGLHRALGRREGYPWQGHFIALPRLKDWLALLGFEVAEGRFAAYAPPFHTGKWLERFSFMEAAGDRWWALSGGVYFVHAVKRVNAMRLIKPQWNEGLVSKLLPVSPKLNNKITHHDEMDTQ